MSNTDGNVQGAQEAQKPQKPQKEQKPKDKNQVSVIFLVVIVIFAFCVYFFYKEFLPTILMNQGKKYLEIKQFDKALTLFNYVANQRPQDIEPIYYEVLTRGKMPPTYENQKRLYEISQYDDCDEASTLADNVLANIRKQIDEQAGPNYIDNVLFEDSLARWNNSHPITYSVVSDNPAVSQYSNVIDQAFAYWQNATNGEFKFRKNVGNTNIVVHVVYHLPDDKTYTTRESTAVTIASITNKRLNQMDIYVKSAKDDGTPFTDKQLFALMLHQIGHALGLGGHSASPQDLMYHDGDIISDYTVPKHISKRDANTLNLLYKMSPDAIDIQLSQSVLNNMLYHEIITTYPGRNFEIETQRLIQDLKEDKRNVGKWVDLAINYSINKQYPRSNYILERIFPLVHQSEENQFVIYYNMALNYYRMKDFEMASRYLKMAEQITTDNETQRLDAFIDVKRGDLNVAKKKLIKLRKQTPDDIELALKLAEIYYREKNVKETRQVLEDLIKHNPDAERDKRVRKYRA